MKSIRERKLEYPLSFLSRLLYCRLNNRVFTCYHLILGYVYNVVIVAVGIMQETGAYFPHLGVHW